MSKLFGGKDPFDDPFFTENFDGHVGSKKEITIEELDNDGKSSVPNTERAINKTPIQNSDESKSFSFRRVAYGGVDGIYYSSSIGQRKGNNGVVLLEIKEEDKTLGQTLHTISRGIHEKGHTLTKKRDPNGKEDSLQILHNLNEDEVDGFEENWKVNADKHLLGWNDGFNSLENAAAAEQSILCQGIHGQHEVSFLGHVISGYYRRFVKGYGLIARRLTDLTKKNTFQWTLIAETAFLQLKKASTTIPFLRLPDFSRPFTVECDASCYSPTIRTSHRLPHQGSFFFQQVQITYERELLALVLALQKWKHYPLGCHFFV